MSTLPVPTPPLRSALKYPSRPTTPTGIPIPASPPVSPPPPLDRRTSGDPATSPSGGVPFVRTQTSTSVAAGYTPKVSFDTFETPNDEALFSFTLQVKSEGYCRIRGTRVFLCAASPDESGKQALEWVLESLVEDGDELVVVRGFDTEELAKDMHDQVREDAKDLMREIQEKNQEIPGRKLSISVEFVAGKVTETITRMIALYRPDSLIVGTRGKTGFIETWGAAFGAPGMGSVSRYCLSHSPVPVIVVRPERQVRKTMEKRRADPKRKTRFDELIRNSSALSPASPGTPLASSRASSPP